MSWSAKWSGLAGSAAAKVNGADSVYFNPAGLTSGPDRELSVNISPTFSQSKGSFDEKNKLQNTSELNVSPVAGLTGKYKLNDKWSFGAGAYTTVSSKISYKNITYGSNTSAPNPEAEFRALELGLSAGYKLSEVWSLGATLRHTQIDANFKSLVPASNTVYEFYEYKNLDATDSTGVRLGVQFSPVDYLKLGLAYRSPVDFSADGSYSINTYGPTGVLPGTLRSGKVQVKSQLPEQLSLDLYIDINPDWDLYTGFTHTENAKNQQLVVSPQSELPNIDQYWKNQKNLRLAFEYSGVDKFLFRGGYVNTSQVTSSTHASALYSPPAETHTLTFGAGTTYYGYIFDVTGEYTFASAKKAKAYYGTDLVSDIEASVLALHVSAKFLF